MKRIMVCLIVLFLLIGISTMSLKVHADYNDDITINSDGSVTPSDAPIVTADNITYALIGNVNGSIDIMRNNIIFDGADYSLRGNGSRSTIGLDLSFRSNVTIKNILISKFYYGLYLSNSSNNALNQNNLTDNVYGLALINSTANTITENAFINDGLWVMSSYQNIVNDNMVNGKPLTYVEGLSDITVNNNIGQVVLVDCNRATVENLILSNTTCSIELVSTDNTRVANNTIVNSQSGIELWSSSNNSIDRNNITADRIGGIGLGSSSTNNTISGNVVTEAPIGMELVLSPNNTISENNITASINSAIEDLSSNTVIFKNNLLNSTYGIVLSDSSSNIVTENNILDNDNGLLIYNSSNNIVYHNNLLSNNQTLTVEVSIPNFFDNGIEGNYWSDYNGTDNNQDGIGDTPYIIDTNNTDHYPLMGVFQSFNVSAFDFRHNVYVSEEVNTISNSTVVQVQFVNDWLVGYPWRLQLTIQCENGTIGFYRITFPNDVLNSYYYPVTVYPIVGQSFYSVSKIVQSNGTCTTIYFSFNQTYFSYGDPNYYINIFPEFPSYLLLPLFFMTTLLAVIFYKRRHLPRA